VRMTRIGLKLALVGTALLAGQVAVRSFIEYRADTANLHREFLRVGWAQARSLARAAEYGLLTHDRAELRRLAEAYRTAAADELLYVAFYDERGRLLTVRNWSSRADLVPPTVEPPRPEVPKAAEAEPEPAVSEDGMVFRFAVPVAVSRQVLGSSAGGGERGRGGAEWATVVCGRSYGRIRRIITEDLVEMLAMAGVVFAVGAGVWLLLGAWLVRPVARLAEGTRRVAEGDFAARVDVGRRRDELADLAESFNRMAARLAEQHEAILAYSRDLEEKVAQRTAELRRANETLRRELAQRRRAQRELERTNAELRQFAYVASHDLQEPLRMVASYVQLLARRYQGRLGPEADEFIAYAVDGAERMKALINEILAYSRVGRRGRSFAPVDTEALLAEVLVNLKVAIEERGAVITHDPMPTVVGDRMELSRLFQNLIGNALKFCTERPRIHVGAVRDGDAWRFSVHDNGIGIDPKYHGRIFGVFQRLHGRNEYPGTGMGLAIAKKIVERHGGAIWVESAPGAGSTFYFTLPVEPVETSADPAETGSSAESGPSDVAGPSASDEALRSAPAGAEA